MNCMSQQGITIVSLQIEGVDVGDLEFIEGKVVAGDYFQVSDDINAITNTIEFIVPSGRTAFLIEAKIVITGHTTPAANSGSVGLNADNIVKNAVQAVLKIDTNVKDTVNAGQGSRAHHVNFSGTSGGSQGNGILYGDGIFNVLGLSLVGDGIKKIEIENTLDDGTAFATMSGYLIDT